MSVFAMRSLRWTEAIRVLPFIASGPAASWTAYPSGEACDGFTRRAKAFGRELGAFNRESGFPPAAHGRRVKGLVRLLVSWNS